MRALRNYAKMNSNSANPTTWDNTRFQSQLSAANSHIRQILDNDKAVVPLEDRHHYYEDKYGICESSTKVAIGSYQCCLENLGIDSEKIIKLMDWSSLYSVTLRLNSTER